MKIPSLAGVKAFTLEKKLAVLIVILLISLVSFFNMYLSITSQICNAAVSKENLIREHLSISNNFIESMKAYGEVYYSNEGTAFSNHFHLIHYDPVTDRYNMDGIGGTKLETRLGNLTGMGPFSQNPALIQELNLGIKFNTFFHVFSESYPDVAWLYYTSSNNFTNIYPWVSSQRFSFSEDLKTVEFFTAAMPDQNPEREAVWTRPYLDQAGLGYIVTLSAPIYDHDTFKGVVSLDLTNQKLTEILDSEYEIYLITEDNTIIAMSGGILAQTEKLSDQMHLTEKQTNRLKKLDQDKLERFGSDLIYKVEFQEAPWTLMVIVPLWVVLIKAFLFALPILLLGIFFYLNVFEVAKRRIAESNLANSLKELKSYQELLEKAAEYDYLTDTVNRRGLVDRYEAIQNEQKEQNDRERTVSIIMGDIDFFKQFNDTYGHAAGDKVLREIVTLMKDYVSEPDIVCRWGGEEFVILLLDRDYAEGIELAELLRKGIEELVIPFDGYELKTTITFGVQESTTGSSIDQIISEADGALYLGKSNGRNQVVGFQGPEIKNRK